MHLFSEDCAGAALRDDPEGPSILCPGRLWPLVCWKFCLFLGILLLMMGVAALATGYTVAPKLEGIGEGELLVLDQWAADYNRALGTCRLAGTALCTAAALLLAICLFSAMTGWLSRHTEAEPLETEADGHAEVSGDESERQQLSPILCDADGHPWFWPPARAFRQPSVQATQPKWSS